MKAAAPPTGASPSTPMATGRTWPLAVVLAALLHALVLVGTIVSWTARGQIGPPLEVELVVLSAGADAGIQPTASKPSSNDAPVTTDTAPPVSSPAPSPVISPAPLVPRPVPPPSVAPLTPPVPPMPAPVPVPQPVPAIPSPAPAIKSPPPPPAAKPPPRPAPPRPAPPRPAPTPSAPSGAPFNLTLPDQTFGATPGPSGSAGAGVNGPAGGGDVAVISAPPPSYPALARRRGEEGRVTVRADIDSDGVPRRVGVDVSSGYPALDQAAVEAVRGWRFRNNSGGTVQVAPVIRFELRPEERR